MKPTNNVTSSVKIEMNAESDDRNDVREEGKDEVVRAQNSITISKDVDNSTVADGHVISQNTNTVEVMYSSSNPDSFFKNLSNCTINVVNNYYHK